MIAIGASNVLIVIPFVVPFIRPVDLADAVSQADSEGVEDLLDDARMDIQELPDPTIGKLELRDYGSIT